MMKFKFCYRSNLMKYLHWILLPLFNILLTYCIAYFVLYILGVIGIVRLESPESKRMVGDGMLFLYGVVAVATVLIPKGVYLRENKLVILRNGITLRNWRLYIPISYNKIECVNVNYDNLLKTKYYGANLTPYGNDCYTVELTLKNGKKRFFSVENAEQFCQDLEMLMDNAKGE